jgi:hypothetical protein
MFNLLTDAASRIYIHNVHWRRDIILRNVLKYTSIVWYRKTWSSAWHLWVVFGKSRLQILPRTTTVKAEFQ